MPRNCHSQQKGEIALAIILAVIGLASIIFFAKPQNLFKAQATTAPTPIPTTEVSVTPSATPSPSPSPSPSPTKSPSLIPSATATPEVKSDNTPPGAGFKRQSVKTDVGTFSVSVVAANIGSTRVIVDTASASDCSNECPALPLGEYVSRNGAFAGLNGSFFCPLEYPSCAGKTNSFDTLLMNKDKYYFNSGNNVYSTIPAVIFGSGYVRFIKQSLEWGRDTNVDGVIANYPLYTFDNAIEFSGNSDGKLTNKSGRTFFGATGDTIYLGIVHSATAAEAAQVLQALGIHNSIGMDNGGSTALWSGGYKAGPGRNIPTAILFLSR